MDDSFINADLFGQTQDQFAQSLHMAPQIPDDDAIGFLEYALLYLNLKESPVRIDATQRHQFSLKTFDGAWLFTQPLDGHRLVYLNPEKERDMTIRGLYPDGYKMKLFHLQSEVVNLQHVRSLDLKEKRGLCLPQAYAIEARLAYVTNKEKWYTGAELYELKSPWEHKTVQEAIIDSVKDIFQGATRQQVKDYMADYFRQKKNARRWGELIFPLHRPGSGSAGGMNLTHDTYWETSRWVTGSVMVALSHYYEWSIYIRETADSIGVRIPILPENHHEVFALRDLPEGAARRKAICHAVRQHTRSVRGANDEVLRETLVKQYFRGETKFKWRGLEVNVIPSEYDLTRSKTSKKFVQV